jgi:hypothetical protein
MADLVINPDLPVHRWSGDASGTANLVDVMLDAN